MRRVDVLAVAASEMAGSTHLWKRGLIAAFVFAGFAVLAACGADTSSTTPAASADPGATVDGVSLEVPDLTIVAYQGGEELGGEEVRLSQVVGHGKPVVLNFYAALCPPCRAEMPDIQRVYEERGDEITVLGVDIGPQQFLGSREDGQTLLTDLDVHYPAGTTFDTGVVRDFRIVGMPTTFFIRADGSLLRSWSGLLTESKLNEIIDELVAG